MINQTLLRLDDIAEQYFNITPLIAKRKVALGILPIPAFRMTDTGRGPLFVTQESLQSYVDKRIQAAVKLHGRMMPG